MPLPAPDDHEALVRLEAEIERLRAENEELRNMVTEKSTKLAAIRAELDR